MKSRVNADADKVADFDTEVQVSAVGVAVDDVGGCGGSRGQQEWHQGYQVLVKPGWVPVNQVLGRLG